MTKMRQRDRVLQYIRDFGSITSAEGFLDLGVMDVPKRICELQDEGYQIKKQNQLTKNRYGESVHFMRYSLESK